MTDLSGKSIALTGTFTKMKRAEAAKALEELGASVGSLTKSTDLLIYGEKAGSKLAKAQSMGVETQNEDWFVALLAGDDPNAQAQLTGALADYMARVDAFVDSHLKGKKHIIYSYYRNPGVSEATLKNVAKRWGVEALSEGLENFYRQANGFHLTWVNKKHEEFEDWHAENIPPSTRMPTMMDMESVSSSSGGSIWILPIEEVFTLKNEYVGVFFGEEDLDGRLRLFNGASQYNPVCCVVKQGEASPSLYLGDDYGVSWEWLSSIPSYLEGKLEGFIESA